MFEIDAIINAFATLFVTIDPIGLAPIFLGLTAGMSRSERYAVAIRAVIIALFLITLFLLAGQFILDTLGITIHAFRIAGGLLLFYTAFEMIYGGRNERKQEVSETAITKDQITNIAIFPLALPLIAGPGTISATILLSSDMAGAWEWQFILFGVVVFILLLCVLSFMAAQAIDKYLGQTGRITMTRLLGVLLAALSVQFVIDGIQAVLAG